MVFIYLWPFMSAFYLTDPDYRLIWMPRYQLIRISDFDINTWYPSAGLCGIDAWYPSAGLCGIYAWYPSAGLCVIYAWYPPAGLCVIYSWYRSAGLCGVAFFKNRKRERNVEF
jgi:hypothetical protein